MMRTIGQATLAAVTVALINPIPATATGLPRPDHVVIVVLENKRYDAVVGQARTPWITALAAHSANLRDFYAETHPSQPNYLALFSGSTQGVTDNNCPHDLGARPNLARQLLDAGFTFGGYAEDLPRPGWRGCGSGADGYVRRHTPWVNFSNVPASVSRPYTDFPADFRKLPTVSFVIPNLCHDMHNCPKAAGDAWLRRHFTAYVAWARTHHSWFVLTFDEDNRTDGNHIATIVAGAGVRPGQYTDRLTHYDLLHGLQKVYGLPSLGAAAGRAGLPWL
ncbi:acid phosphatase [Actinoplanes ianthinogenes]|uniref:Acid phosphatase n=1 Tax=Actinoplanes ianthinogenes TaxID=122358 RepID=A0ABN6CSK5_9ACTN|nr:alkaline phosphatase family protein [Actinoplanes ianthinogenes]BCJ47629.1 acid phosphatase [Actinoplanes ianthinogenes]GGR03039.1 acid phosphatase [Actinoplanes ianthinogenes]